MLGALFKPFFQKGWWHTYFHLYFKFRATLQKMLFAQIFVYLVYRCWLVWQRSWPPFGRSELALWLKDGFNFLPHRGGRPPGGGDFVVWGPSTGIYLPHYAANLQNLEIPIFQFRMRFAWRKWPKELKWLRTKKQIGGIFLFHPSLFVWYMAEDEK